MSKSRALKFTGLTHLRHEIKYNGDLCKKDLDTKLLISQFNPALQYRLAYFCINLLKITVFAQIDIL
jgi:hypothetical protein